MSNLWEVWTGEQERRLRDLHREGLSASVIAADLGKSRSGVCGKIWRMGLATPTGRPRRPRRAPLEPPAPKASQRLPRPAWRPKPKPVEPRPHLCCSLLELTEHTCRWPIGEPREADFFCFCGDTPAEGRPYCAEHCLRAYAGGLR